MISPIPHALLQSGVDTAPIEQRGLCTRPLNLGALLIMAEVMLCDVHG